MKSLSTTSTSTTSNSESFMSSEVAGPDIHYEPVGIIGQALEQEEGDDGATSSHRKSKMFVLFLIMGMGNLFPYNAMITCVDWFTRLHPTTDIISEIVATMLLSLLLTTVLLLLPLPIHVSSTNRIFLGFTLESILLFVLSIVKPSVFFCNAIAALVGVGDAISQSGLYVLAASVDPRYTAAVTLGSALAGLLVSLWKLCTKAMFPHDLRLDTTVFFVVSAFMMLGCVVVLRVTVRLLREIGKLFPQQRENASVAMQCDDDGQRDNSDAVKYDSQLTVATTVIDESSQLPPELLTNHNHHHSNNFSHYWETTVVIWKPLLALFINFFVTLSLFPGPITSMRSDGLFQGWLPVILITTLNLFDCIGRILLSDYVFQGTIPNRLLHADSDGAGLVHFHSMVFVPSLLRLFFFPIITACVVATDDDAFFLFHSDVARVLWVAVFAVTNGFVATASFMAGPAMIVHLYPTYNDRHRDAASLLLMLACFMGLTAGAFAALKVDSVLTT